MSTALNAMQSFGAQHNSLIPEEVVAAAFQVSRTDANALIALDPVDLTVTKKFDYTSILPEAQVCQMSSVAKVQFARV